MRTPRRAARVAVLDPEGAVFLFKYHNAEVGVHWALPGGGLEADETPREGALRDLREETGWTDVEPGAFLGTWEHDFTRADVPVRQYDHMFVARGPRREPVGGLLADVRTIEGILAWRWWTRQELTEAEEAVWPPELLSLLTEFEGGHWVAVVVALVAMLASVAGLVLARRRGSPELGLACVGLTFFVAQAVFLAVIRPITPVWMTSTLVPPFAFALACGWRSLARGGTAARSIALVAAGAWLAVGLAIFGFFVREIDTIRIGRGVRSLSGFVMVLSYSRATFALFTVDQTLESFLRGFQLMLIRRMTTYIHVGVAYTYVAVSCHGALRHDAPFAQRSGR